MSQEERLNKLIHYLEKEKNIGLTNLSHLTYEEKFHLFRGLCNVREPLLVEKSFLNIQDQFLEKYNAKDGYIKIEDLEAKEKDIFLWQGDITRLKVDAIVNAANSKLLGCMEANHNCIDNIIHTKAGVQLRLACHEIMQKQGRLEPVGKAKITSAYNLPAKYIIHTVGPYIDEKGVTPLKEQLLASSYKSCLQLAEKEGVKTIAFCCISTGVFNFPNERAAEIALETVKQFKERTDSEIKVIFNVFKDKDYSIYESLLKS